MERPSTNPRRAPDRAFAEWDREVTPLDRHRSDDADARARWTNGQSSGCEREGESSYDHVPVSGARSRSLFVVTTTKLKDCGSPRSSRATWRAGPTPSSQDVAIGIRGMTASNEDPFQRSRYVLRFAMSTPYSAPGGAPDAASLPVAAFESVSR